VKNRGTITLYVWMRKGPRLGAQLALGADAHSAFPEPAMSAWSMTPLTPTRTPSPPSGPSRHGRGRIWVREQPRRHAAVLHSMVALGRCAVPSSRILLPPESPTAACNFLLMCDGYSAREHGGRGVPPPEIPTAAQGPGGLRGSPPGPGHRGRQGQGRRRRGTDEDGWVRNG